MTEAIRTRVLSSHHALPDPVWSGSLATVLRAGEVAAGPNYAVTRSWSPGHDLLWCVAGSGTITLAGVSHPVRTGQFAWLAGDGPHGHRADPASPWQVLWLRCDGPMLAHARRALRADLAPVFTIQHGAALTAWFARLFRGIASRGPDLDLLLNALVAELLVLLAEERRGNPRQGLPPALVRLMAAMGARPALAWTEADMQAVARVSPAHLRRQFRKHLKLTPRAWLRRERILLAQDLLLQPGARVSDVAEHCGFADVFHFSRDFRRSVGLSPSTWRQTEIGLRSA